MNVTSAVVGAVAAVGARAALPRLLMLKFRRDTERLSAGDHSTLLKAYADDAVLRFAAGDHRWSGEWVGKAAIERFLQNFTAAKIQKAARIIRA